MIKNILIFLIILIIIFLLYILTLDTYKNSRYDHKLRLLKYNDIKHTFKTGDIILFGYKADGNIFEKILYLFRTKFVGCDFGHVGMIVRFGDQMYLLETVSNIHDAEDKAIHLNNKKNGGARFIKLDTIIKEYRKNHDACFGVKYIEKEIDNNLIFNILKKYKHKEFPNRFILSLMYIIDIFTNGSIRNSLNNVFDNNVSTCSEFVYDILCDANILKRTHPSKLFWPHHLNNKYFHELCKIKYSKTYEFSYEDIDMSGVDRAPMLIPWEEEDLYDLPLLKRRTSTRDSKKKLNIKSNIKSNKSSKSNKSNKKRKSSADAERVIRKMLNLTH